MIDNDNKSQKLLERYELRQVNPDEAEIAAQIEAICFPPSEACTLPIMRERVAMASDSFLVAIDKENGKMAGFINALCTNDRSLEDELFTNTKLHDPMGDNVMICSVSVLPEYRGQGLAKTMMKEYLEWQKRQGKKQAILTCVPGKVEMYARMGYSDRGLSDSTWGGEIWHEMWCPLN